jgi:hypothetical protein
VLLPKALHHVARRRPWQRLEPHRPAPRP